MDYRNFVYAAKKHMADYLPSLLPNIEVEDVRVETVNGINGTKRQALIIKEQGIDKAPVIYLEGFYDDYVRTGAPLGSIFEDIAKAYEDTRGQYAGTLTEFEKGYLQEYESGRLYLTALNYEKSRDYLKDKVYKKHLDLALMVRYYMGETDGRIASAAVRTEDAARWEVSTKSLFDEARNNTPQLFPSESIRLNKLIEKLTGWKVPVMPGTEDILVLSNSNRIHGAVYMAYPEIVAGELERQGITGDCYILPSSIHEVIIVPDNGMSEKQLSEMVRNVNMTEVSNEEYLSDSIYRYDSKEKQISMVNDPEAEKDKTAARNTREI